jgi:hypothetical protein
VRLATSILVLTMTAAGAAQTPTVKKGDRVRLGPEFPSAVPGLSEVRVVATGGDQVTVHRGLVAVNGRQVQGLSFAFLDLLPPKGIDEKVPPGYALVLFDGKGASGPVRYWAVTRVSALLSGGSSIVAGN